jgi:N-alpha-acetyltransferase 35, NatC auxiliary subunit
VDSIQRILDRALSWIQRADKTVSTDLMQAISVRLDFRKHFLRGVEQDVDIAQSRSEEPFENCLHLIPALEKSRSLGTTIPEAFSQNIQRKLASTVPLRPVVSITPKATVDMLRQICQAAIDIHESLNSDSTYDARVRLRLTQK